MNILVTGANGLVGRVLCSFLDQSEDQVIRAVRTSTTPWQVPLGDLNENTQWDGVLTRSVDAVVHLSGNVPLSEKEVGADANQYHQVNTLGAANLARQSAKHGAKRLIFVSTVDDVSTPELIRRMAVAFKRRPFLVPVLVTWMKWAGAMLDKRAAVDRFVGSLAVDIEPLQEKLGWRPPYTMQAELAATAQWYCRVGVSL